MNGWRPCAAWVSDPHTPDTTECTSTSPEVGAGVWDSTTSMELGETTTRRIRSGTRMSTSWRVDVNLPAVSRQQRACVDVQVAAVEPDSAQIPDGRGDTAGGGGLADTDDRGDARGTRRRDSGGCILEHRTALGCNPEALRGEQVRG